MTTLFPYQSKLIADVRGAAQRGARRILCQLPTAGGKTVVFSEIARLHLEGGAPRSVLVVVHRRELVQQAVTKLRALGLRVGILAGDIGGSDLGARVVVASIPTLVARGLRPAATLLIVDECQHAVAETWAKVAADYASALILGFTATPIRSDGRSLGDAFDEMVCGPSVRELQALKRLVPCDVLAPPEPTEDLWMSPLAAYQRYGERRKAVIFAGSVEEAKAAAWSFIEAGVVAGCVDGETHADARDLTLLQFGAGAIRVLTNVFCLTEGWDCPSAEVAILARGCSNPGTWLQMAGRILRASPGKSRALLIDLRGAVYDCGLPDEDRKWSLGSAPCRRVEPLKALQRCETCLAVFRPAAICPRCGANMRAPGAGRRVQRTLTRGETLERISGLSQEERDRRYLTRLEQLAKTRIMPGAPEHRQKACALRLFTRKFMRPPMCGGAEAT